MRVPRTPIGGLVLSMLALGAPAGAQQPRIVRVDDPRLPTSAITLDTLWTVGRNTMDGVDSVFQFISGIALDRTGLAPRLLVLDIRDGVLRAFDANGRFLSKVGRPGEGPGEFRLP